VQAIPEVAELQRLPGNRCEQGSGGRFFIAKPRWST
jgi:hypothetical protein